MFSQSCTTLSLLYILCKPILDSLSYLYIFFKLVHVFYIPQEYWGGGQILQGGSTFTENFGCRGTNFVKIFGPGGHLRGSLIFV